MVYGYSVDALKIDLEDDELEDGVLEIGELEDDELEVGELEVGALVLREDYDPTQHRVAFSFSDDDKLLDGDYKTDEVGDDANQEAKVLDTDGNLIAGGQVYDEMFYTLVDDEGNEIWVDVIEIDGKLVGYLVSQPLVPGEEYKIVSVDNVTQDPDTILEYSQIVSVPCFGPGTHLLTTEGEIPVEWLAAGDKLITRDNGAQSVLWVGRYPVSLSDMATNPALRPYAMAAGALGLNCPSHDTLLSGQHRVLLSGFQVELIAGAEEAFAATKHLSDGAAIGPADMKGTFNYTHVLLPRHEVVLANNLWVESLLLGGELDAGLAGRIPQRFLNNPKLRAGHRQTARPCLRKWEVVAMRGRQRCRLLNEEIARVA